MKYGVIIPTRSRYDMLKKVIPSWIEHDLPIVLMVEPSEREAHAHFVNEMGWSSVKVRDSGKEGGGIAWVRRRCVGLAAKHLDAFLLVDDDTIITKGDPRGMLRVTAQGKAMAIAGWMPNYGLWFPNGNALAKEDIYVIRPNGPDRVIAMNPGLTIAAGNYDAALHAHGENAEMNRQSIKSTGLWYVHSGVHIKTFLKHHGGPGGLNMYFEERSLTNEDALHELHEYVFAKWGPRYINPPDRSRMMCKWRQMYHDFVGPKCAAAVKDFTLYEAKDVKPARRMFA